MMKRCSYFLLATLASLAAPGHNVFVAPSSQPILGVRNIQILSIDGLRFRDSNHNGQLDPFEDWRLSSEARTADLMQRLSLENIAGLLVHGTLQPSGNAGTSGTDHPGYDLERARGWIVAKHVNSFVTRLEGTATDMAVQNNRIQEMAEQSEFGIPVTISCDPKRHHFQQILGDSVQNRAFSLWPEALGFAAIGDAELTRRFGDTVRREYLAVGIRESLAPQADLATEPRWTRTAGTFGEDAALASRMVEAYVTGVQNGANGLGTGSVAAVVKHWAGYGAAKDGWDSHSYYGREFERRRRQFYCFVRNPSTDDIEPCGSVSTLKTRLPLSSFAQQELPCVTIAHP